MQCIPILSIFAFFSLSLVANSQQEIDPSANSDFRRRTPEIIRIHAEYYEISTLEYAELIGKEHIGINDNKLREQLLQMAKDDKAKLIETQTVTARSGERANVESVSEYIFPTEYEPQYTKTETNNGVKNEVKYESIATAFETRNLGSILEVEPILGHDGKTIDLTLRPEIVSLIDHTIWESNISKTTKPIKMPTFYTYKLNTSLTMIKGQFHMASVFTPTDDQNKADPTKKLLLFVKADVLTAGK